MNNIYTIFTLFTPVFFILYFSRGPHKVEEACEMYCRAANMFKMAKNWSGAWGCSVLRTSTSSVSAHLTDFWFCNHKVQQLWSCHKWEKKLFCNYMLKLQQLKNIFVIFCLHRCWKCVLQSCTSPYAATEQTWLRHQFYWCRKCLQEVWP